MLFSSSAAGPWSRVKAGEIPLVIKVHNADIMATLLLLKAEFEVFTSATLRMTFARATEACLLAAQSVSVILAPARPYPDSWDHHRVSVLPGPPFSQKTAVTTLLQHGITLALGVQSEYAARNAMRASSSLGCVMFSAP
ncbi:hypothetical protein FB451DRAFT_1145370, partial [Mycena latifolia]